MMVENDREIVILKFTEPLQRYLLTCQANSALLDRYFALGSSNSEGVGAFQNKVLEHF
jgi:hypothetical protein